jgi:hypothetical protein
LSGVFIPLFSVAIMFGYFRRTAPLTLWLPVLLFLLIHSYFPNKQERFLLPIVPLFFLLGYVAWEQWRSSSAWWQAHQRLWNGVLTFTWTINLAALTLLTFSYSKRSRVEALYGLRDTADVRGLLIEDTHKGNTPMPPLFYSGHWDKPVQPYTDPRLDLDSILQVYPLAVRPNIALFIGTEQLDRRMAAVEVGAGPLTELFRAEPGALDRLIHWLNPVNRNEIIVVARIGSPEAVGASAE